MKFKNLSALRRQTEVDFLLIVIQLTSLYKSFLQQPCANFRNVSLGQVHLLGKRRIVDLLVVADAVNHVHACQMTRNRRQLKLVCILRNQF